MTRRRRPDWAQLPLDGIPAADPLAFPSRAEAERWRKRSAQLAADHSAERFRERYGDRRPRHPVKPPTAEQLERDRTAIVFDVGALIRERAAAGRFGVVERRSGREAGEVPAHVHRGAVAELLERFDAAAFLEGTNRTEAYADRRAARDARRARSSAPPAGPDPLSVVLPVTLQGDVKALDRRHLAGMVRAAIRPLMPRRGGMRHCGERTQPGSGVRVHLRELPGTAGEQRAGVAGVVRCGSRCCPACAPRVSSSWARVLKAAIWAHRRDGGSAELATFAPPHDASMSLAMIHEVRQQALRRLQSRVAWRRLKESHAIVGTVAAREQTHGENGWHPHAHVLLATAGAWSDRERTRARRVLYVLWARAVRDVAKEIGLPLKLPRYRHVSRAGVVSYPAVDVRPSTDDAYLSKMGLAAELTGAVAKQARAGNRNYLEIAADYARDPQPADAKRIREYIDVLRGTRALTWSQGRSLFPVAPELQGTARRKAVEAEQRAAVEGRTLEEIRALLRRSPDLRVRYLPELVEKCGRELPYDLIRSYGPIVRAVVMLLEPAQASFAFITEPERAALDDAAGRVVAGIPARQFVALARVLRCVRGDARFEIAHAVERAARLGLDVVDSVRSMLEAAYQLGRRLRRGRRYRRLERWLCWLQPAPDDAGGHVPPLERASLVTPSRIPTYALP